MNDKRMIKIEGMCTPVDFDIETTDRERFLLWIGFPISFPIGIFIGLIYGFSLKEVLKDLLKVYFGIKV